MAASGVLVLTEMERPSLSQAVRFHPHQTRNIYLTLHKQSITVVITMYYYNEFNMASSEKQGMSEKI